MARASVLPLPPRRPGPFDAAIAAPICPAASPTTTRSYTALRELIALEGRGLGTRPHRLEGLRGTPFEDYDGRVPCDFLHAGQTCDEALAHFAPRAYLRALPV